MNNPFSDIIEGAKLITSVTNPDELAEVERGLQSIIGKLEARLAAMSDEPVAPEPVIVEAERAPEPRKPRVRFTGRMTPAEVRRIFSASRMAV